MIDCAGKRLNALHLLRSPPVCSMRRTQTELREVDSSTTIQPLRERNFCRECARSLQPLDHSAYGSLSVKDKAVVWSVFTKEDRVMNETRQAFPGGRNATRPSPRDRQFTRALKDTSSCSPLLEPCGHLASLTQRHAPLSRLSSSQTSCPAKFKSAAFLISAPVCLGHPTKALRTSFCLGRTHYPYRGC